MTDIIRPPPPRCSSYAIELGNSPRQAAPPRRLSQDNCDPSSLRCGPLDPPTRQGRHLVEVGLYSPVFPQKFWIIFLVLALEFSLPHARREPAIMQNVAVKWILTSARGGWSNSLPRRDILFRNSSVGARLRFATLGPRPVETASTIPLTRHQIRKPDEGNRPPIQTPDQL